MKEVDRHLFFDKVKSIGIDSCLTEISKNDWVDDMNIGHVPRCALLPHRHTGRLDWGKAKSIQLRDFRMGQVTTGAEAQFCLRYHSSDVFTVIGAEVRPSQRVNKKPHKVWVAVQTNGTILLIVH